MLEKNLFTVYTRSWYDLGWATYKNFNGKHVLDIIKNCQDFAKKVGATIQFVTNLVDTEIDQKEVEIIVKNVKNEEKFTGKFEDLESWLKSPITINQVTII